MHYYTSKISEGPPKSEEIHYLTAINAGTCRPLDELITEARAELQKRRNFSDIRVDRVKETLHGRYRIELTCFH